ESREGPRGRAPASRRTCSAGPPFRPPGGGDAALDARPPEGARKPSAARADTDRRMIGAQAARARGARHAVDARLRYWRRILPAYLGRGASQLTFWHDQPALNSRAFRPDLGEYYQDFPPQPRYAGPFDGGRVPRRD